MHRRKLSGAGKRRIREGSPFSIVYGIHFFLWIRTICAVFYVEQSCGRVGALHLSEMEVVWMDNHFDFKDLMSFGMFILALLTFIFMNLK